MPRLLTPLDCQEGHQCLSAGSPVGTLKSDFALSIEAACHQCLSAGSPVGTLKSDFALSIEAACHQCLSAGSPVGTLRLDGESLKPWIAGHQCLSAGSPVGTRNPDGTATRPVGVTSAFRLGVLLGRTTTHTKKHDYEGHQCLSAGSPVGTAELSDAILAFVTGSPVPFGWESCWDTRTMRRRQPTATGHQCLSAGSPLGTEPARRMRF